MYHILKVLFLLNDSIFESWVYILNIFYPSTLGTLFPCDSTPTKPLVSGAESTCFLPVRQAVEPHCLVTFLFSP